MKRHKNAKKLNDGTAMLNLGCGARAHPDFHNIDFSPYARLAHHRRLAKFLRLIGVLSDYRYENILQIDPEIIHWDVREGIPFDNDTFDVIYHSHFITHLDRNVAELVTYECYRTLRKGGVIRAVVPDLKQIIAMYNQGVEEIEAGQPSGMHKHQLAIEDLFELMVRTQPCGTANQNRLVRVIEKLLRGGIENRGELRCWHYDKYSMGAMLEKAGFRDIQTAGPTQSRIESWPRFNLDVNEDRSVYKPGSLYIEAVK